MEKENMSNKKTEETKSENRKKEILLDDNLMIKRDLSDLLEEDTNTKSKEPELQYVNINREKNDGDEKVSILMKLEAMLERIPWWFAEKYEQLARLFKEPENELDRYKYKIRKEKWVHILKVTGIVALVLLAGSMTGYLVEHHKYKEYKVVERWEKADTTVASFMELDGDLLHYNADGVSLTTKDNEVVWTDGYQMTQPVAEKVRSVLVIYDLKGTQICVYNSKGKMGGFQTDYPIMAASVSAKGTIAAILENGETTLINYYTETGDLIASSSTNMRNPGYPVDLCVSKDGLSVAVSYFVADDDAISSNIAFYNFGDAGRKKEDNMLGGVRCAGVLVPKVQYMNNDTVAAYTEHGFKIFSVGREPEEIKEVIFEEDIVSSFSDGKYIGFVFRNNNLENPFVMKVYDQKGTLKMEQEFDILYDNIKINDGMILLNNTTQMEVYSLKGIEKYSGSIEEGIIHDVVKIGRNRYAVVYNEGVLMVKLK